MNKLNMLKIVDKKDDTMVKNSKNLYNMLVLDFGLIPDINEDEAIIRAVSDMIVRQNVDLTKELAMELNKFIFKRNIESAKGVINIRNVIKHIPEKLTELIKEECKDSKGVVLCEEVIYAAMNDLMTYHPLTTIDKGTIEGVLKRETINYNFKEANEEDVDLMYTLEEQMNFEFTRTKDAREEREYELYKLMLEVNKNLTKEKLFTAFVKGRICRNNKLVTMFYNLFKDDYEKEYDVTLYHGVKPKWIDGEYNLEQTFKDYNGYTSFSKAKEIAVRFACTDGQVGLILETQEPVKGLDIEQMIHDYRFTESDFMINQCKLEEEALVDLPDNLKIYELKDFKLVNGVNDFNIMTIDLKNSDNNCKLYNHIKNKLSEVKLYVDEIKVINKSFLNDEESLNIINRMIEHSCDDVLYLVEGYINEYEIDMFKKAGFINADKLYGDKNVSRVGLYSYAIHESQAYLIEFPEEDNDEFAEVC